jgi:methionyl-tRNA formyltransferase
MRKYQVVFFGTSEFAVPALNALVKSPEVELKAVVTQPDKPTGRHQELTFSPVKTFSQDLDVPVLQPESLRKNDDFRELIENLEPDLLVVVSYGQIIPQSILSVAQFGAVNIHGSLLPRYRGASPIQQSLLQGDTVTGVTIMKLNAKMDEGPVLFVKKLPIEGTDTFETLYKKLAIMGGEYIAPIALDYMDGSLGAIPQNHAQATYCQKIEKDDGLINWSEMTATEIHNRLRAFTPWPGCFTYWEGKRLKILEAQVSEDSDATKRIAGAMSIITNEKGEKELRIGAKEGSLTPLKLQIEGKGVMDQKTFLNGYRGKIEAAPQLG